LHAAAEESDSSDSCGQRQGKKAPKKNRKGDDSDSSSNDSASSKRRQHKKVHKNNRKGNDSVSNNSDSSDSGDRPPVRKRKGKEVEKKARKTILVGGEKKRRMVSQCEEPLIQLQPPSSGAAALSPESVSDNMHLARMQAEEMHSAQARQRQHVGQIAALVAKAEAKRDRSLW